MIEEVTSREVAVINVLIFDKARQDIESTRLDFNGDGYISVAEIDRLLIKLDDINNIGSASAIHRNLSAVTEGNEKIIAHDNVVSVQEIHDDVNDLVKSLLFLKDTMKDAPAIRLSELNKISRKLPSDNRTLPENHYDLYIIHKYLDRKYPELVLSQPKTTLFNRDYYGSGDQFIIHKIPDGAQNTSKHIDIGTGNDIVRIDYGINTTNNTVTINRTLWPDQIVNTKLVNPDDVLLIRVPYDFSTIPAKKREAVLLQLFSVKGGDTSRTHENPYSVISYNSPDSSNNTVKVPTNLGSVLVYGPGIPKPVPLFENLDYTDIGVPYDQYKKRDKYLTFLDNIGRV